MTNSITHFEIYGAEPEGLAEFYRGVFGWRIEQMPGVDYWPVETGEADNGLHGGLMYRAIAGLNGWMFYQRTNVSQILEEDNDVFHR